MNLEEFQNYFDEETLSFAGGEEVLGFTQLEDGRIKCLQCGKNFSSQSNANRHYKLNHQSTVQVGCPICKKVFRNKIYQENHLRNIHSISVSEMKHVIKPPTLSATALWNKKCIAALLRCHNKLWNQFQITSKYLAREDYWKILV